MYAFYVYGLTPVTFKINYNAIIIYIILYYIKKIYSPFLKYVQFHKFSLGHHSEHDWPSPVNKIICKLYSKIAWLDTIYETVRWLATPVKLS